MTANEITQKKLHTTFYKCNFSLCTHQLTKLHDEEKRDGFTALPQTLKDVGMLQAPGRTAKHQASQKDRQQGGNGAPKFVALGSVQQETQTKPN